MVVVVIQDELAAEELVRVLEDGGLEPYLATIDPSVPLPTLGSMVESGRRLVIGLENGDLGPALPNVYDGGLVQEVPYKYSSVAQLEGDGLVPTRMRGQATHRCSCSTTGSHRRRPSSRPRPTPRTCSSIEPDGALRNAVSRSTSSRSTSTGTATCLPPWTR